jgi:hypothetical protein
MDSDGSVRAACRNHSYCPRQYLDWGHRCKLLLERLESQAPDLLCLQGTLCLDSRDASSSSCSPAPSRWALLHVSGAWFLTVISAAGLAVVLAFKPLVPTVL